MYQSSSSKKPASASVGQRLRGEVARGHLEQEVEHALHVVVDRVVRDQLVAEVLGDLAEHVEVVDPARLRVLLDLRCEALPEGVVDVLHRVHPEAVDAEVADPRLVDVDHAVDDHGVLREEVVEAEEVAVLRVLAHERRVAAVVVEADVVEPARDLHVLLVGRDARAVGEALRVVRAGAVGLPGRGELGERAAARVVAVVEDGAVGVPVGVAVLGDVLRRGALLVLDDVGRVVGDDVEVDLDAARVGGVHEVAQVLVGPEVRVDLREVGDPVAVVAGGREAVVVLDRLVLEARREPDGGGPESFDVVDLIEQALEVAAVVPALVGRVEARLALGRAGRQPAVVVGGIAVAEPVGHDEVEVLVGDRRAEGACRARRVVLPVLASLCRRRGDPHGHCERGDQRQDGRADAHHRLPLSPPELEPRPPYPLGAVPEPLPVPAAGGRCAYSSPGQGGTGGASMISIRWPAGSRTKTRSASHARRPGFGA